MTVSSTAAHGRAQRAAPRCLLVFGLRCFDAFDLFFNTPEWDFADHGRDRVRRCGNCCIRKELFRKKYSCISWGDGSNHGVWVPSAIIDLTFAAVLDAGQQQASLPFISQPARLLRAVNWEIIMPRHRLSFVEKRRNRLARRPAAAPLESRNLITDPLNLFATSLGIPLVGNLIISSDVGGRSEAR